MNLNNFLSDPLIRRFFLRLSFIFVILSVLFGGAWYGYGELDKASKAKEKPKIQKLNKLQKEVQFLQRQLKLYQQYGDKYQELLKKGLVKKQDRVFWTDALIRLSGDYLIPKLQFNFSAERRLTNGQLANIRVPDGVFYYSRLKLNMNLQHEEDLIRIFETMNQKISPLYLVEGCQTKLLKNTSSDVHADFDLINGNVSADCTLILFHTHATVNKSQKRK